MIRHEILVAGGGLVGCAIARGLQLAGFDAALVERGSAPHPYDPAIDDLRVYAISPASIDWLAELGAWEAVRRQRVAPYRRMRVWSDAPERALVFDADDLHRAELGCIVENSLLQAEIWATLGAARYTGADITDLALDEDGATLRLADGRELSARLLIAADGVDSRLRALAGIDVVSWPYPEKAIVAHVRTERAHGDTALQRFLPTGPLAFLPLSDGRSSIVWSSRDADRLLTLDDGAFQLELASALQYELGAIHGSTARASFPLRLSHAREYVRPSFALAGDSAHAVHPLAGQGVNLGLADGRALVRTLVDARDARRDFGSLRTLKRYERARLAANLEMLAVTDGLARAFNLDVPGWAGMRDTGMAVLQQLRPLKAMLMRQAVGV